MTFMPIARSEEDSFALLGTGCAISFYLVVIARSAATWQSQPFY